MDSTTYYQRTRKAGGLFTKIFLSEKGSLISPAFWAILIILTALRDQNQNPVVATAIWVVLFVILIVASGIYYWATTTAEERDQERRRSYGSSGNIPYTWGIWAVIPGSLLIMATVALFIVGPFTSQGYIVMKSPAGVRVVNTNAVTAHLPFYESVQWWNIQNTVAITTTAQTQDGKSVVANVQVSLAMDDSAGAAMSLFKKLGSPKVYRQSLEEAVKREFSNAVGQYQLETLPGNLVLEDLVGTSIGLEELSTRWSGALIINDIHRTADIP